MKLIKSIYWEQGDREELVYRFPFNTINMGSVLTVNESQEALFFKNGVLCDVFGAGRHVLSTANLPKLLDRLVNRHDKVDETFTAEVWFVNKLYKRNMLWNTGWLRILDPYFQIPIKISSRGQYGVRISDSALFLKKLIGTFSYVTTELVEEQFRIDVKETVKGAVSKFLKENKMNINQIGEGYKELSKFIGKDLKDVFEEYGVELLNFNIEDIGIDENDSGYQKVMDAVVERAKLNMLDLTYVQKRQLEIAQDAANNEGNNSFMNIGMGLSMGSAVGQMVGNVMQTQSSQPMSVVQPQQMSTSQPPQVPPLPQYYVAQNGQTTGPFTIDIVQKMIQQGEVTATTYIYKVGGKAWELAVDDAVLSGLFTQMIPPPPPPLNNHNDMKSTT